MKASSRISSRATAVQTGLAAGLIGGACNWVDEARAWARAWPWFARRGREAPLLALFYAMILWMAMHAAIAIASHDPLDCADPGVITGGFMAHFFVTMPAALTVKQSLK